MGTLTFKQKLIEYAHQTEDKIRYIRELQKQIADLIREHPKEYEEAKQDPEIQDLDKKLKNLMDELW